MQRIAAPVILLLACSLLTACNEDSPQTAEKPRDLVEETKSFDGHAIAWLGERYDLDGDGSQILELTESQSTFTPARYAEDGRLIKPDVSFYSLGYGSCRAASDNGCRIPISLVFDPPCKRVSNAFVDGTVRVRGIDAKVYQGGRLQLDTADFTLDIAPPGATEEEILRRSIRIAENLVGANAKASHITRDSDFTPADCPAARLRSFDEFPVLWLGEAYDVDADGTPESLESAQRAYSPPVANPSDGRVITPELVSYSVSYGTCDLPTPDPNTGEQACRIPLTMVFYEPCSRKATTTVDGQPVQIRGTQGLIRALGIVRVYARDFMVVISAPGTNAREKETNGLRVANDLRGANAKASHIMKDSDFTPAACSNGED